MIPTETKISPMMEQWHACKAEAKDAILLFRLGDFYEAFYDDAILCSTLLDLTLTKRQLVPMSGIPAHTAEGYIDKLVSSGHKVAIAEQLQEKSQVKGLVKRGITRIVTPGTLINSSLVRENANHYIAAITQVGEMIGIAFLDLTCSICKVTEVDASEKAANELYRFKPKEVLISKSFEKIHPDLLKNLGAKVDYLEEWRFDHKLAYEFLIRHFKVHTLDGFGLKGLTSAINASGALLAYVEDHLRQSLGPLTSIQPYKESSSLSLDRATLKNLELLETQSGSKKNCLIHVLDQTRTPMGARLLKQWLLEPLVEIEPLYSRYDALDAFLKDDDNLHQLQEELKSIRDLERLMFKISTGNAGPRDYIFLKNSLEPIQAVKLLLRHFTSELVQKELNSLDPLKDLIELITSAINDEPPLRISDGSVIKLGYNQSLDELRSLSFESKTWMTNYQQKIREESGIKTLKVGYTKISGFYIEVTKGQVEKVPEMFTRRQTLTNAERYITKELKEYEEKILLAEEKIQELETSLFQELKIKVTAYAASVLKNAKALATLDALGSLALVAKIHRYVRPTLGEGSSLEIVDGRHPVVEAGSQEKFIPNDTKLDGDANQLMLITGPNMAGKSTYIRQVALIVILAQMGSFVPAKKAHIDLVDKVFTRIGASDDLSRGQSTFMVEMTESAAILNNATSKSLVILDEIGRGTSTYDGISLAWSIAEYLLTESGKKAKTLFATHYFELTKLEEKIHGAVNYNVAVHESSDQIVFLRKIVRGGTDRSYGIHVAKLAGLPSSVLLRAEEILLHLIENSNQKSAFEAPPKSKPRLAKKEIYPKEVQLTFF